MPLLNRHRLALAIFALALAVRLVTVIASPGYAPLLDARDYHQHAASIASGAGYPPTQLAPAGGSSAFRPPLYPALLGTTYVVTGPDPAAGRVLGCFLGALSALLLYLVGLHLWGRRAGGAAGFIAAVFPPLVWQSTLLLTETLFAALAVGALLAAVLFRRSPRTTLAVAAGVLCGLTALTRANGLLIVLPVAGAVWTGRPLFSRRALGAPAAVLVAAMLTLSPWTVRNAEQLNAFVPLTTQGGFALAGTYNPSADQDPVARGLWRAPFADPGAAALLKRPDLDEPQLSGRLRQRSLDYVRAHPSYPWEVLALNSARILHPAGSPWLDLPASRELNLSESRFRLMTLSLYPLLALVALGVVVARRRPVGRRIPWWLWATTAGMLLSTVVFSGSARYRGGVDPFLVLFAALGMAGLLGALRSASRETAADQRPQHP